MPGYGRPGFHFRSEVHRVCEGVAAPAGMAKRAAADVGCSGDARTEWHASGRFAMVSGGRGFSGVVDGLG